MSVLKVIVKRLGEFMIQNFRQNATAYLAAKAGDEAPVCGAIWGIHSLL